jgi:hypothetical protein
MCRRQPINPRVVHLLRHDAVIDTESTSVLDFTDSSGSTFESEFGRFMNDSRLDNENMSLEV